MNKLIWDIQKIEKRFNIKLKRNCQVLGLDTACYDDQTEVLTDKGWKLFKDLDKTEKVATLNKKSNEIEYQKPINYYRQYYKGQMYKLHSKNFDSLTTFNHKFYYASGNLAKYKISTIVNKRLIIPITGEWKGRNQRIFDLPSLSKEHKQTRIKEIHISMKYWLEFLGWYLSEGSICEDNKNYTINIYQIKQENRNLLRELLNKMPFHYNEYKDKFTILDKQLYNYLKNNCYRGTEIKRKTNYNCYNKKFPDFIKKLSPELLKYLWKSLLLGDGTHNICTNTEEYYTSSYQLCQDIQELLFKLGYSSYYILRPKINIVIKDRKIRTEHNNYIIRKLTGTTRTLNCKQHLTSQYYQGNIYCVQVPNEIIYVRRKKCAFWCGNTKSGYCIAKTDEKKLVLEIGFINVDVSKIEDKYARNEMRYNVICDTLQNLIENHWNFQVAVIEDVYYSCNPLTLILLARIGAIAYTLCKLRKIKTIIWKSAVSARKLLGLPCNKKKEIVQKEFSKKLGILLKNSDEIDAIILALVGLLQ